MHDLEVPVIGGETSVALTSAATLDSLGVSVGPLGSATLSATGADPMASFTITGGTVDNAADGAVILHQGSGLELSNAAGVVDLRDFRVDTINDAVNANVSVNGTPAGNVAVFSLGDDGALTLTPAAADVVDQALDTTAITPDVQIGVATVAPVLFPYADPAGGSVVHGSHVPEMSEFLPLVDGQTVIELTSAATLASLDVLVAPLGSAAVTAEGDQVLGSFGITGGTVNSEDGTAVILHQGSGLMLSDAAGTLGLTDFLVDTQNSVVDANVAVNGVSAGNAAVFDIGLDGALTLTMAAADVVSAVLGTEAITSDTVIGYASPSPITLPTFYADTASVTPADPCAASHMVLQDS